MKIKQKNIRVFEFECEDLGAFEAYLDKNAILLRNFLLLLKGDADGAFAKECNRKALWCASCYVERGEDVAHASKEEQTIQESKPQEEEKSAEQSVFMDSMSRYEQKELAKTILVAKNLRSGEDIDTEADVTITGRINSGAKVKTSGNAIVLGTIDGSLEAWGDYMMIKKIGKGTVVFRGQNLKRESFDGKTKLITFDGKLNLRDI